MRLPMFAQLVASLGLLFALLAESAYVHVSPKTPENASEVIDHTFLSFSLPIHNFTSFTGNGTVYANGSTSGQFTYNLLNQFKTKTGVFPIVRLGGTSADRSIVVNDQVELIECSYPATGGLLPNNCTGTVHFPAQIRRADGRSTPPSSGCSTNSQARNDSDAVPNMIEVAQLVVDSIGDRLYAFEIGNEPDLLYNGTYRPAGTWNISAYETEWTSRAKAVSESVLANNVHGLPRQKLFQGLTTAFQASVSPEFSVPTALQAGYATNPYLKTLSLHRNLGMQSLLLNATNTALASADFVPALKAIAKQIPGTPLVNGEGGAFQSPNFPQYGEVLGTALWFANYLCYAASIDITRVHMIQGQGHSKSAWFTTPAWNGPARTLPALFGMFFWADFLGTNENVRIAQLTIDDVDKQYVTAYGSYHDDCLAKVAILNNEYYGLNSTGSRPVANFTLSVPEGTTSVQVDLLTGPGADMWQNVTWAGQTWNYSSLGLPRRVLDNTVYLAVDENSTIHVPVEASSCVIVTLQ